MYFEDFKIDQVFDLGELSLKEEDIISFAKEYDPLKIHIDHDYAKDSIFNGIISSGFHHFTIFWKRFVKMGFADHVVAGIKADFNWINPCYPDKKLYAYSKILDKKESKKKTRGKIYWTMIIKDEDQKIILDLKVTTVVKKRCLDD